MTDIVERLRQWEVFYREEPARTLPRQDLSRDLGEGADTITQLRKEREAYRRVTGQMTEPWEKGKDIVQRLYKEHFDNLDIMAALLMAEAGETIEKLRAENQLLAMAGKVEPNGGRTWADIFPELKR